MKLKEEQTLSSFASHHQHCQSSTVVAFTMVTPQLFDAEAHHFSSAVAGTSAANNGLIQQQAKKNKKKQFTAR